MRVRSALRGQFFPRLLAVVVAVSFVGTAITGGPVEHPASAKTQGQQTLASHSATSSAAALTGSNFKAGLIISNYLFYKNNAMTQAEIQAFLEANVSSCGNSNCLRTLRATTTDRAADRTVCAAYKGATNELASTIIFKVQQACGISAKVLLVTLQKEQGLITKSAPSDAAILRAMGYGCPDTAPCATKYFGLYNQLYNAAWQFKRYSTPDPWGSIQPGVENLRYSPAPACGSKKVTVVNNATAALYNYTPYTPNAAALANLAGTGNTCSSYGNRNFWVYYTNWFGSTLAGIGDEMVGVAYAQSGGATGALGAEIAPITCGGAPTCIKTFQHGLIYWTSAAGAIVVSGAIGNYYLTNGGPSGAFGIPLGAATAITIVNNGNGQVQNFATVTVQASSSWSFAISGSIRTAQALAGGPAGVLGWPIAEKVCGLAGGGCSQQFQHGTIYAPATGLAIPVQAGALADLYSAQGGVAGPLGYPVASAQSVVSVTNGNGVVQKFAGGAVYSSAIGSFVESGSILTAHTLAGGPASSLGWPIGAKLCGLPAGGCSQQFQNGVIYARATGVAVPVGTGAITDVFAAHGGVAGSLGYPVSPATTISSATNGNGIVQVFAGGVVYSSAVGSFVEAGAIRTAHALAQGPTGRLGWPSGDKVCTLPGGGCSQSYQHGTIYARTTGIAIPVMAGAIADLYATQGGAAGTLGYPTGVLVSRKTATNGNGSYQGFEHAWLFSSTKGTFAVSGAILTKHRAAGGVRGKFGWPVASQVCGLSDGGCSQAFQHGTLFSKP